MQLKMAKRAQIGEKLMKAILWIVGLIILIIIIQQVLSRILG